MANITVSTPSNTTAITQTDNDFAVTAVSSSVSVTNTVPNIAVTIPNTSFEVTTPEAATINVGNAASTITITGTDNEFSITIPAAQNISVAQTSTNIAVSESVNDITIAEIGVTNTDQLIEGSVNLFYTNARSRASISVNDLGGYGSLTYNSSTGVISFEGISQSEIRAQFTAGTGVAINSGEISIGQSVATTDTPTFGQITLSNEPVNNSDAVTKAYVDAATSAITPQTTDDVPEGATNLYYTEQRVEDHVFQTINIDNKLIIDNSTEINTNDTEGIVIDSWDKTLYRTVKYIIQASQSTRWQCLEALVIHDGTEAYMNQYADVKTGDNLITLVSVGVLGNQVQLAVAPASNIATTFRITKILMTI